MVFCSKEDFTLRRNSVIVRRTTLSTRIKPVFLPQKLRVGYKNSKKTPNSSCHSVEMADQGGDLTVFNGDNAIFDVF